MKKLTRLMALLLAVLMLSAVFVGCHKKDEIAFKIGDFEYTSAMYSCSLYFAATSARNDIYTFVEESGGDTKKEINYNSYKFDAEGKVSKTGTISYEKYVRDEAVNQLKKFAALDAAFKNGNLKLDDDQITTAEYNATSYWNYGCDYNTYVQYATSNQLDSLAYSYMPYYYLLEKNGVSFDTYKKYYTYDTMYGYYFEHLYGEKGEKAIAKDDITKYLSENYTVANTISFSKTGSDGKTLSEEKLKELKAIADGYAERLNNGEDFETIYKEENKRLEDEQKAANTSSISTSSNASDTSSAASNVTSSEASSTASSTSSATTSSESDEYKPAAYVGIFGNEGTAYEHKLFKDILSQDLGKAVVLEDTENSMYLLVSRFDILEEEYWYTNLRTTISYALKQEEFDKSLDTAGAAMKFTEDTYATKPFKVKKIKFDVE